MPDAPAGTDGREAILSGLNRTRTRAFHFKTWILSGLGFFTDAYDLFIIGSILTILPLAGWTKLSTAETALVASTALMAAVLGALVFGRLLDYLGRKAIYGFELVLLVAGALGSAFLTPVNGVFILIAWRFLLGVGIGGDYATSSTIMAEYSNTKNRGMLVGMVFSMQSLGLLAGPLAVLGLLYAGVAPALMWKLLFAFGAIPAAAVIYGRRSLPETPKFTVGVRGNARKAAQDLERYSGLSVSTSSPTEPTRVVKARWSQLFTDRRLLMLVIGTAGTWFLMDWALYGNSIMASSITGFLVPSTVTGLALVKASASYNALIFGVAALPGYWLATFTMDRIGRKPIQVVGFAAMAVTFLVIGVFHELATAAYLSEFLAVYGLSYFFIEFGPNVTTFVYPPEVFPVSTRGLGSGMAAAGGKTGAALGTVVDVYILATGGLGTLFLVLGILALVGLVLTILLLPEPKQRDLEEVSQEGRFLSPMGPAGSAAPKGGALPGSLLR